MENKKKIAIVTNIPAPYRVDFFNYLCRDNTPYEWYFIFAAKNEDNRSWNVNLDSLTNVYFLMSKTIKISGRLDNRYIHIPANVNKILSKVDPDVVICWEYNPTALMTLRWCKRHNRKFIHLTDGTLNSEKNIGLIQKLSRKRIIKCADGYLASSTKAKEKLIHWGADETKIELALLTVDLERYLQIHRKPVEGRILYVGSFVERKGLDLLFQALPLIQDSYELHIVGSGTDSEKDKLLKTLDDNNQTEHVMWMGFLQGDQLLKEYEEASVFVLPTREDCFGLVLLEAMASGVPVVSSKYADGAYDMIEEGKNGTIVDPYDANELADAICSYLSNTEDKRIGNEEGINKFRYNEVASHYYEAIKKVLEK